MARYLLPRLALISHVKSFSHNLQFSACYIISYHISQISASYICMYVCMYIYGGCLMHIKPSNMDAV